MSLTHFRSKRGSVLLPIIISAALLATIGTTAYITNKIASEVKRQNQKLSELQKGTGLDPKSIEKSKLADDVFLTAKLSDGSITAVKIQDGSITADKLDPTTKLELENQITKKFSDITNSENSLSLPLKDGTVKSATIIDSAVTSIKLADGSVTEIKITDGAVTGSKIAAGQIQAIHLESGSVISAKIVDGAITESKIMDNAVTTSKLANLAVTAAKIALGAILTDNIADQAVTANKISDQSIVAAKIATGAITSNQISSTAAIDGSQLSASAGITGSQLASDGSVVLNLQNGETSLFNITNNNNGTWTIGLAISCTTNQIMRYNGTGWTCTNSDVTAKVVHVAKSGGDYTDIQTAVNFVKAQLPSATNPWTIEIAPGRYNLPTQSTLSTAAVYGATYAAAGWDGLDLRGLSYVTFQGSGQRTTQIYPTTNFSKTGQFLLNMDATSTNLTFKDLYFNAGFAGGIAKKVNSPGDYVKFESCDFEWSMGSAFVLGIHEGGFYNCAFYYGYSGNSGEALISSGTETWTAGTNVTTTTDAASKVFNSSSSKIATTASIGSGNVLATIVPTDNTVNSADQLYLWIKASSDITAGTLQVVVTFSDNSTKTATINMPVGTVWKPVVAQFNGATGNWVISKVELKSAATVGNGVSIWLNDAWYSRQEFRSFEGYAFNTMGDLLHEKSNASTYLTDLPRMESGFMEIMGCVFAIRNYQNIPKMVRLGTLKLGLGSVHFVGNRIHHTMKNNDWTEEFVLINSAQVEMSGNSLVLWSQTGTYPNNQHYRLLTSTSPGYVALEAPTINNVNPAALTSARMELYNIIAGNLNISGKPVVYRTADLPPFANCDGCMFYDYEVKKLKFSDATAWQTITSP